MIRRLAPLAALLLALLVAAPPAGATFKIMAYGDSITQGIPFCGNFGCAQGYPSRVRALYGCNGVNCALTNRGKSGEWTAAGLTRLQMELNANPPWDLVILMHGTNDVFNQVSNDTIEANLAAMDTKAKNAGADTAHASIIWFNYNRQPPNPPPGLNNMVIPDLRNRVSSLAASRNRYFIDNWNVMCPFGALDFHGHSQAVCFDANHWFDSLHPQAYGYTMLGDHTYSLLNSIPIPTAATPTSPNGTVYADPTSFDFNKESPDRANWYQIQIDNGGNLHDEWYQENDICSGSSCSLPAPITPGVGTYSWRVRTRNPRGHGPWSASSLYTVTTVPEAPVAQSPKGEYVTGTPTYRWTAAAGAASYEVEVREDGAPQGLTPASPYAAASVCSGSSCELDLSSPGLTIGPTYTWKVRGVGSDMTPGPWSAELTYSRVACNATNPLVLEGQTVTTPQAPERACVDLHTGNLGGGDYVVGNGGVVTHQAGDRLTIFNGFTVEAGGTYTAKADG